jgi:hypothetical protein
MADSMALQVVPGILRSADSTGAGVPHATLYIKNRITKHVQTLETDDKGAFTVPLEYFGIYDVYDNQESSKAALSIDASSIHFIEVKKTE